MTCKEKLVMHCPDPEAKRRLAVLFGLELQNYLTWSRNDTGLFKDQQRGEE